MANIEEQRLHFRGGCNIGSRPIDQHLKGFRALGAGVEIEYGKIIAEAEKLEGTHLYFDVVSVGATNQRDDGCCDGGWYYDS